MIVVVISDGLVAMVPVQAPLSPSYHLKYPRNDPSVLQKQVPFPIPKLFPVQFAYLLC